MCDKAKLKEILMEVFQSIDKDNSGSLEQSELEAVFKAYTDHPECPADFKAEHGSPDKIKGLCEVRNFDTPLSH